MCDEVHLYGFWPYPVEMRGENFRSINYHYFNKLPFVTNYHNVDLEYRILVQFHMLGVAQLHVGSCLPNSNNDQSDKHDAVRSSDEVDPMKTI